MQAKFQFTTKQSEDFLHSNPKKQTVIIQMKIDALQIKNE